MKNYHSIEVFNNGSGERVALKLGDERHILTLDDTIKLIESLLYGVFITASHLSGKSSERDGAWPNKEFTAEEYIRQGLTCR